MHSHDCLACARTEILGQPTAIGRALDGARNPRCGRLIELARRQVTTDVFFDAMGTKEQVLGDLGDLCDWWAARHDPGVLFLFYDELLARPGAD
jgi:hypothetical protein